MGAVDAATKGRESEIADLLRHSGTVEIVDDIRGTKWMKLVSNATTLVSTALVGLSMHEAVALPGMRELMVQAGQEALDIGAALGHRVRPIFGMKPDEMRRSNRLVETMLDTLLAGFTLPHTKTTVLPDWMKGRRSEVDDLNGLVAAEAARLGRAAPVNAAIADLAHRVEQGTVKPSPSNLRALQDLVWR